MSGSSQLFSKSMDKFLTLPRNNQQGTDQFFFYSLQERVGHKNKRSIEDRIKLA